ncbi:6,7-dimethyl-8-ribityllumazine synthase [Candidatus Marinamargulisbacteria bacterium SCGC AG-414-C22]|nr:6,7-dimethyl-8-ribityllumazine synthase [Candidatus Marinamargulisbacteria bacterium SCGC AG-414-C22]
MKLEDKYQFNMDLANLTGSMKGSALKIAIVIATYNGVISEGLLHGAKKALKECNVADSSIVIAAVDGVVEIPVIAQRFLDKGTVDAVVALGSVIQGDTAHFDYVCQFVTQGLCDLTVKYAKPIAFGVLTTHTYDQALERAQDDDFNKGYEAALTAVKTVTLKNSI